ncbi:MAG: hypothetical protein LBK18_04935 [Prevotellaceae bacterium]|jgi:hypothetical protein|nr:hypothetical protein [Prevotellaceae bacterium]
MKKTICFIALALSSFLVSAEVLPINNVTDSVTQEVQQNVKKTVLVDDVDKPDVVSSLTLAVNAINNIQTWSAVIIAILTLIVAVVGLFGYFKLNQVLKSNVAKIQAKIQEINEKEQEFDRCISQTKAQEKYMQRTNVCFFEAFDKVVNQITNSKTAKAISQQMLHNYQITNLYSADDKFAAFAHLEEQGTMDDIQHLDFVSKYDSNKDNKKRAREIIGIIKHKNAQ